jgi:hypothetical protein
MFWIVNTATGTFKTTLRRAPKTPENSVPQTIVFRYKEIGDKLCGKHRKKGYVPV